MDGWSDRWMDEVKNYQLLHFVPLWRATAEDLPRLDEHGDGQVFEVECMFTGSFLIKFHLDHPAKDRTSLIQRHKVRHEASFNGAGS